MRLALLLLPVLFSAGCASMSKSECLTADWRAVGYEDGARGAPVGAISSRREACAKKAGVAPDMDAWLAGRQEGLAQFCRPQNGFNIGARGEAYHGVCEGAEGEHFLAEYRSGYLLFEMQRDAQHASVALSNAQSELWNVRRRIAAVETALLSPTTRHPDRVDYLLELKELMAMRAELEGAVAHEERRLAALEAELADYRAFLAEAPADRGAVRPVNASY